jgi:hypothetical protein
MTLAAWGLITLLAAAPGQANGRAEAVRLLDLMKAANDSVVDLKCVFRFQVTKNGKEFPLHLTVLRMRTKPETIHMTYLSPHKGRKVLYVKGHNHDHLKVRPGGFWRFLVVSIDPQGERAMEGAIDPLTAQGFPNIVKKAEEILKKVRDGGGGEVSVDWNVPGAKGVYARFRVAGPEVGEMIMLVDQATYFPFQIVKRVAGDKATYTYEDVQLNPGMQDAEFAVSSGH